MVLLEMVLKAFMMSTYSTTLLGWIFKTSQTPWTIILFLGFKGLTDSTPTNALVSFFDMGGWNLQRSFFSCFIIPLTFNDQFDLPNLRASILFIFLFIYYYYFDFFLFLYLFILLFFVSLLQFVITTISILFHHRCSHSLHEPIQE